MKAISNYTHETVTTQFVEANIRYAYLRFGKYRTIPLLFLGYFNSNMDAWNPEVTNGLAADHEVILFDNAGAWWIIADILRIESGVLAEHWDVIQDEATKEQSESGNPLFGNKFPTNVRQR